MTLHRRAAYGLCFESELAIPEMPPADPERDPDVTIKLGSVPDHLDAPNLATDVVEATPDDLLLRITDVGRFRVTRGSSVIVESLPGTTEHDLRVFLLGTCVGALLHQRGALVLHASGVGTESGAVLFAGQSKAGKSTILGELLRRGFDMVVDDVAGIFPEGDGLVLQPSYPRTRVWADTARRLGVETEGLQRTRPHMDKYERQIDGRFWNRPSPIRKIYHLAGAHGDELTVRQVPQMLVVPLVVNNTYRQRFLDGFDMRSRHFELASRIARSVPVAQVVRPVDSYSLDEMADTILDDLD